MDAKNKSTRQYSLYPIEVCDVKTSFEFCSSINNQFRAHQDYSGDCHCIPMAVEMKVREPYQRLTLIDRWATRDRDSSGYVAMAIWPETRCGCWAEIIRGDSVSILPGLLCQSTHIVWCAGRVRKVRNPVCWRELLPGPYRWRFVILHTVLLGYGQSRLVI